jgi:tetratricopeptide (TPR) repeat protein
MGMGNPSPAALAAKDIAWPWFLQDLGKLYLAQAGRENQRAAALNFLQRPAESEKWYRQAAGSFRKTAEYWKNTPVYYDLVIGEAKALSGSGGNQAAIDLLLPLKIPSGDPAYAAWQYYLGIIYEKNSNKPDAVECFRRALNAASAAAGRQMDSLITMLTGDRREAKMILSVKMMCETNLSYAELLELLKKYNLVQEEQSSYRWKRAADAKKDEAVTSGNKAKPAADDDFKVEILKKSNP